MSLSINNDKYLQPEDPETKTYEIGYSICVTFEAVTQIEAESEEHARDLFDQQRKSMVENAVDSGERTDLELDVDYLLER